MRVRAAVEGDVDGIVGVFVSVAEEGSIGTQPSFDRGARASGLRGQIQQPGAGGVWALVDEADEVLGVIGSHETRAAGVLAIGMAIIAGSRGQGGGGKLLDRALERAWAEGAHKVELEV